MRTSTFDLHAKAADVDLWKLLRDWRTEVPPVPYDEIALRLREYDIRVSRHTVWRWVQERNIDTARPYAPRRRADESAAETPTGVQGGDEAGSVVADARPGVQSVAVPPPESALERELRISRETS